METEKIYFIIIVSLLLIVGIFLFLKSRKNESKSLKMGTILPLIVVSLAFLMLFIGPLIYILLFTALPLCLLGLIFSIIALIKTGGKLLKIASLLYSILCIIASIYFYSGITM